jgi:hypothetical protein
MDAAPSGWLTSADGVGYPPAPWHLRGTGCVSLWRVPAVELPTDRLPPGARPVTVLGRALVGTAWITYGPGGVLAYDEVLAAVRVRVGGRTCTTVTHIWVDHPASVAGGRELWGVPKELAAFRAGEASGVGFAASAVTSGGQPIAAVSFRGRAALPGRWPFRTRTAQRPLGPGEGGGLRIARAEVVASVELGAAAWRFAPDGPLGFLAGREPFLSVRLSGFSLRFGG